MTEWLLEVSSTFAALVLAYLSALAVDEIQRRREARRTVIKPRSGW